MIRLSVQLSYAMRGLVCSTVCVVLGCCSSSPPSAETVLGDTRGPNVVLYVVDTLRADALGCYGNPIIETPAIDRFAREGALFENVIAQSSWTRASMASILTGLYPDVHGAEGRNDRLADVFPLLSEMFREHGYATACVTTNPNMGSFFGFDRGWDEFEEMYAGYIGSGDFIVSAEEVNEFATQWIDTAERPFFLLILTVDPHEPYAPPEDFDRYTQAFPVAAAGDDESSNRERTRRLYYGEVAYVDHSFGGLLDHLRMRGLYDDTLCVLTSDHGESFWEHGFRGHGRNLYEELIRVPLVMRYPAGIRPGVRFQRPVELIDLVPTILQLAGKSIPSGLDGRSVLGPPPADPQPSFASLDVDGKDVRMVREYPWKLIWHPETDKRVFFDLAKDPEENRAISKEQVDIAGDLFALLFRHTMKNKARRAMYAGGPSEKVSEEDLPADTRDALEALGYIEPKK